MSSGQLRDGVVERGATWSYVVRVPDPVTGRTRPKWVGGFATEDAAKAARDEAASLPDAVSTSTGRRSPCGSTSVSGWIPTPTQ